MTSGAAPVAELPPVDATASPADVSMSLSAKAPDEHHMLSGLYRVTKSNAPMVAAMGQLPKSKKEVGCACPPSPCDCTI